MYVHFLSIICLFYSPRYWLVCPNEAKKQLYSGYARGYVDKHQQHQSRFKYLVIFNAGEFSFGFCKNRIVKTIMQNTNANNVLNKLQLKLKKFSQSVDRKIDPGFIYINSHQIVVHFVRINNTYELK